MIMWKLLSCNEFNQEPTNWLSSVGCRVSYARSFSFTWTVTSTLEYKIDGAYTRVLRAALNKSWKNHPTNKELYGNILSLSPLPISKSIRKQRLAGHYWRSKDELAGDLLLWRPSHGKQASGHPKRTYVDQLTDVTG